MYVYTYVYVSVSLYIYIFTYYMYILYSRRLRYYHLFCRPTLSRSLSEFWAPPLIRQRNLFYHTHTHTRRSRWLARPYVQIDINKKLDKEEKIIIKQIAVRPVHAVSMIVYNWESFVWFTEKQFTKFVFFFPHKKRESENELITTINMIFYFDSLTYRF